MSVCVALGDGGVSKTLEPCSPKLEAEVSAAILFEVRCAKASCESSCELGAVALEGVALVSGNAVEPGWEEVTPFPG